MTRWGAALLVAMMLTGACQDEDTPGRGVTGQRASESPSPQTERSPAGEPWFEAACRLPGKIVERIARDFYPGRSPELIAVPENPNYFGGFVGTSHSGPWDYVQEVPLIFYGPGWIRPTGPVDVGSEPTVADMAPTLARLLETSWPEDRPGRVLEEILLPRAEGSSPPKLVVVAVWDGGGTNVLDAWPDSWPTLRRVISEGASITGATVGSSPSNTPAIHANIGTGAFPDQHGIVDIDIRAGDDTIDSFEGGSPEYLEIPTLGDLYDQETDNDATVGMFGFNTWHFGMMSRGTHMEGGDRDLAALIATEGNAIVGSERWYELPAYLEDVPGPEQDLENLDREDGEADGLWLGNDVLDDLFLAKQTPAFVDYQQRLVTEMLDREAFGQDSVADLFYVNYKPIDLVGHRYNMLSEESRSTIEHSDAALDDLIGYLNRAVGRGQWVLALTADHGQTPLAESTGAWPIDMSELTADVARHLEVAERDLFDRARPGHFWLDRPTMERNGITAADIAAFFTRYSLEQNTSEARPLTEEYADRRDEPLFAAAWPSDNMAQVSECASGD